MEKEKETVLRKMVGVALILFWIGIISGGAWLFMTLPLWQFALSCIGIAITIFIMVVVVLVIKTIYKMRHSKEE